jgi:hypothetical protein
MRSFPRPKFICRNVCGYTQGPSADRYDRQNTATRNVSAAANACTARIGHDPEAARKVRAIAVSEPNSLRSDTMKRIFALGILLGVSIALAACGGSTTNTNLGYNSYGANNANAAAAGNTSVGTTNMNGSSNMSNGYTYNSNMSNMNMNNSMTDRGNSMTNNIRNTNATPRGSATRTP